MRKYLQITLALILGAAPALAQPIPPPALSRGANGADIPSVISFRSNLGLGTMATQAASAVAITGGDIRGTPIGTGVRAAVNGTTALFDAGVTVGLSSSADAQSVVVRNTGAAIRSIAFQTGTIERARLALNTAQQMTMRMSDAVGANAFDMLTFQHTAGTRAVPHLVKIGPGIDLAADEGVSLDVRGPGKFRSLSTYASNYPAFVATDAAMPYIFEARADYTGVVRDTNNMAYAILGSQADSAVLAKGGGIPGLEVDITLAPGYNGGRIGGSFSVHENVATQQYNDSRGMIGMKASHHSNSNVGGVALDYGNRDFGWGNMFAFNTQTAASAGATYRRGFAGGEINLSIEAGAQFVQGHGLLFVLNGAHEVQPERSWSAITVANASQAVDKNAGNFKTLLSVGDNSSGFPVAATGNVLQLFAGVDYNSRPSTANNVIHTREAILTGGVVLWDGGRITQGTNGGAVEVGRASLRGTATGGSLDVDIRKTATVSINTPGANYYTGSLVKTPTDMYIKIATVVGPTITGITKASPPVVTSVGHGLANGTYFEAASVGGMTQILSQAITNITTSTTGQSAVVTVPNHGLSNGTHVAVASVGGMTQLNGNLYYKVANAATNTFTLTYPNGTIVDTANFDAYTSGGTITIAYKVANATADTFEITSAQDTAISSVNWSTYTSGGIARTTIPATIEMYRPGWEVAGTSSNVSTEAAVRVGAAYGSGLTVDITWSAGTVLQVGASVNTLIGSGSDVATNATNGMMLIPTVNGTPTGTVGASGQAALIWNRSAGKLCVSTGGGTWVSVSGGACS